MIDARAADSYWRAPSSSVGGIVCHGSTTVLSDANPDRPMLSRFTTTTLLVLGLHLTGCRPGETPPPQAAPTTAATFAPEHPRTPQSPDATPSAPRPAPAACAPGGNGTPMVRPPDGGPTRLALLVGVNAYPNLSRLSQLKGAVSDVARMQAMLTTRFDFPPENVWTLCDGDATREGILDAFEHHLIARSRPGDIVVFHYSGHGSMLPDASGDELDGLDETLVPSDSDRHGARDIRDDEIQALLGRLPEGVHLTLIFDSCHSGTATRDLEGGRPRRLDRDSLLLAAGTRSLAGADAATLDAPVRDYVLISGARADQQARELKDRPNGALTYYLTETLSRADSALTYTDLMDVVRGRVNEQFASQTPQLEGTGRERYAFSDASSLAEPHLLVQPLADGRARLQAGAVHGMTAGSRFDVYPPGTKRFAPPAEPIASLRLTHVDAFTSEAEVLSAPPDGLPAAARAVEREHRYPELHMQLRYEGLAASPTLQAVKQRLDTLPHIQAVAEDADTYHLRLYERDGRIHVGQDEVVFSTPVPLDEADAVDHVVRQVSQWARWFNVLALEAADDRAQVVLHLRFDDPNHDGSRPWNDVSEGATLFYSFENRTEKDLYITGVALFATGKIQPFYPFPPGAGERLKAGQTSDEFRIRNLTLPEGDDRPYTRDILKVFATTTPVDLSTLMQEGIRGDDPSDRLADDPLGRLLLQATGNATRDFTPEAVGDWFTAQTAYIVRRR